MRPLRRGTVLLPGAIGDRGMASTDDRAGVTLPMKPRDELRHWSTYATVGEWYLDYHGYVPIEAAAGLSRLIRETGMAFPDAYRALLGARKIIHIDPADDLGAPPEGGRDAVTPEADAAKLAQRERRPNNRTAVHCADAGD